MENKKVKVSRSIIEVCLTRELAGRTCRGCVYNDNIRCQKLSRLLGCDAMQYIRNTYKNHNFNEEE